MYKTEWVNFKQFSYPFERDKELTNIKGNVLIIQINGGYEKKTQEDYEPSKLIMYVSDEEQQFSNELKKKYLFLYTQFKNYSIKMIYDLKNILQYFSKNEHVLLIHSQECEKWQKNFQVLKKLTAIIEKIKQSNIFDWEKAKELSMEGLSKSIDHSHEDFKKFNPLYEEYTNIKKTNKDYAQLQRMASHTEIFYYIKGYKSSLLHSWLNVCDGCTTFLSKMKKFRNQNILYTQYKTEKNPNYSKTTLNGEKRYNNLMQLKH